MERYTYFDGGKWRMRVGDTEYSGKETVRLAAYEETGLVPEAVEHLKLASMGKAIAEIKEFEGVPVDRLRELAKAKKEGRLVVLPCDVGDTVYVINPGDYEHEYKALQALALETLDYMAALDAALTNFRAPAKNCKQG